jgi:radical SAM superfamily enzyme YgiQ (UPF0313 family)
MLGLPTETPDEVRETISMLKEIDPDYYSPAFFTPHPGSHLYDYCVENDLMAIRDHDDYARNPTGPKIRGQDKDFLLWALVESQRRTPANALRREARRLWNRYARPDKVVRKVRGLLGGPA